MAGVVQAAILTSSAARRLSGELISDYADDYHDDNGDKYDKYDHP